jgi:DNA-binding NarL/FixJ family response regulator
MVIPASQKFARTGTGTGGPDFSGATIRILIVDDIEAWHCIYIEVLRRQPHWEIVGIAQDAVEAIQKSQHLKPDVVLLDVGLEPTVGLATARQISEVSPASRVLFLTTDAPSQVLENILSAGAHGYVAKRNVVLDLVPAVQAIAEGKQFLSQAKSL